MADHRAFAKRLQTACDNNVNVPPYGKGQQTWLAKRVGISQEAVRRWFYGESRPRPHLLTQLAALLEVDESWLALGITDAPKSSELRVYRDQAEGAAYICFGLFKAAGYECAFADGGDPFDFHAIKRGRHFCISTALARSKSKNILTTRASNFDKATHLCVVMSQPGVFEVFHLPWSVVTQAGNLTSYDWQLEIRRSDGGVFTLSGEPLARLETLLEVRCN